MQLFSSRRWAASIWENTTQYVNAASQCISSVYSSTCESVSAIYKMVFPINLATQRREFGNLPTCVDLFLGKIICPVISYIEGGVLQDKEIQSRVQRMVDQISFQVQSHLACQEPISILNSDKINAFTTCGGKIFFYKGLLDKIDTWNLAEDTGVTKEDILAAISGHEVAHAAIGHVRKSVGKHIGLLFLLASFDFYIATTCMSLPWRLMTSAIAKTVFLFSIFMDSRKGEYEADKLGIELAHKAGYDMRGSLVLHTIFPGQSYFRRRSSWLENIGEWLSTHPSYTNRWEANKKHIQEIEKSCPNPHWIEFD